MSQDDFVVLNVLLSHGGDDALNRAVHLSLDSQVDTVNRALMLYKDVLELALGPGGKITFKPRDNGPTTMIFVPSFGSPRRFQWMRRLFG